MDKPKIYATGNENLTGEFNISYYIVEKDENFLEWLGDLLIEVMEIKDGKDRAKLIINNKEDETGAFIGHEIYVKEISKMNDLHEHYSGKDLNRIDIFYGKNRAYITLRKSKETREKFAKFMLKTKEWIKVIEAKELPVYAKKLENQSS